VIVAFNGQTIDDTGLLLRLIADATIGTTATISVSRDGRRTDLRVPIVATASRRQRTQ
jgi:S1-C subfamily serine protease